MEDFLSRRRRPEDQTGEPGSCDSSEVSDTSAGTTQPKAKSRTLRRRAAQRIRRMLECQRTVSLSDFMSFLEKSAVTPKTGKKYAEAISTWLVFLEKEGLPCMNPPEVDVALVKCFNHLFFAGVNPWRGETLLAAVLHQRPELGKLGGNSLPRTLRSLRGWRRLCPSRTRIPFGWDVWAGVAAEMVRRGLVRMAIAILIGVDAYLRPSELLSLRTSSLVPPSPESGDSWSLLLHPSSRGARSKVGESDETVLLNSRRLTFLQPALRLLAEEGQDQPLWHFDYPTLYRTLAEIGRKMNLIIVPYLMRHSGVSIDRAEQVRSTEECQKRGRWKHPSSMRRYEKTGRLGDSWRLLHSSLQTHCRQMTSRLPELVVGGGRPPQLPAEHRN